MLLPISGNSGLALIAFLSGLTVFLSTKSVPRPVAAIFDEAVSLNKELNISLSTTSAAPFSSWGSTASNGKPIENNEESEEEKTTTEEDRGWNDDGLDAEPQMAKENQSMVLPELSKWKVFTAEEMERYGKLRH